MLSKRCHFQKVLKMLSKCCQNVVKMLSFLCLISSSFSAHFTLKEKCGKFIIRNVVKMLSFFMDPKRLHLCSIKAPFMLHFASPVPLGMLRCFEKLGYDYNHSYFLDRLSVCSSFSITRELAQLFPLSSTRNFSSNGASSPGYRCRVSPISSSQVLS